MGRISEIAKLLNVSKDVAEKVLNDMDMTGIDYSECTQAEFDECALASLTYITTGSLL